MDHGRHIHVVGVAVCHCATDYVMVKSQYVHGHASLSSEYGGVEVTMLATCWHTRRQDTWSKWVLAELRLGMSLVRSRHDHLFRHIVTVLLALVHSPPTSGPITSGT